MADTYIQMHVKQMRQFAGTLKSVHHVYLITPDGFWEIQADTGLVASPLQIRLALTPNVV